MYVSETLDAIFEPQCHLCDGEIRRDAYGDPDSPYGWEVDHDEPRALGGGDELDNLRAAHPGCNRSKGAMPSHEFRALLATPSAAPVIAALSLGIGIAAAVTEPDPSKRLQTGFAVGLGTAALLALAELVSG